jgi:glycosyltransferase involved in cell wall biosynthesis
MESRDNGNRYLLTWPGREVVGMPLECGAYIREMHEGTQHRPLHVYTLTPFYPSERNGVAGCFVAEPLKMMESLAVESSVEAVQSYYTGKATACAQFPAQWTRYMSVPGGLGLSSAGMFLFARLISRFGRLHSHQPIDLIHAHAPLPCGHAASLLARELNIPFVVTVHGLDADFTNQVHGRAGEWCRRMTRYIFRSASRVICISEAVRQKVLESAGGNCPTSVVYNGVDPNIFAPANEPGSPKILSVGNLIPIKGHELLLRAIAMIQSRIPEVSCDIIGEGPELKRLQALATELNIADKVQFPGRKDHDSVAEALRQCMIFALPSRYEALGCVYLEAMSAAKPVIACRGQGIAEVIEHGKNGWLIGVDDVEELAHALVTLFEDAELRNRMRLAARRTILKSLTLQHQARRLSDIYYECAA